MNYQYIDDLFLLRFPDGLIDLEFNELSKKHRSSDKILELINNEINIETFLHDDTYHIKKNIDLIIKIVSKSGMVSVFEKVAFKNYLLDSKIHHTFLVSLYNLLSNKNEENFNNFVFTLNMRKNEINRNVATWPIITFFLLYFEVNNEIFIKPTTIKRLGKLLEYDLKYVALPNYETYQNIKKMILTFKKQSKLVNKENNIMVQAIMYCAMEV